MEAHVALFYLLLVLFGILVLFQILARIGRKVLGLHFPAPAILGYFLDSRWRKTIQPPEEVMKRSGVGNGMWVLEVGLGSGAFMPYAAKLVGTAGGYYGLDIQFDMLKQARKKQKKEGGPGNTVLVAGSAYSLPFRDDSLDLVYMVAVLQEIPDIGLALAEVKRVLKPGGTVSISEFLPDPDYPFASTTVKILDVAGFNKDGRLGNFFNYTVKARKL
jgi:ubiquinone/menaquinone biosynthesis C-methylase UbiE